MNQMSFFDEQFDGFGSKPVEAVTDQQTIYRDPNQLELSLGNSVRQGDLN